MRKILTLILAFTSLIAVKITNAQSARSWNAKWIAAQNDEGREYGVYYFRKSISLAAKPASFNVHVSGDNRYKLYVNGTLVSLGPARGDTYYWNYETVDLAPYLTAGKNTVSALVFNEAAQAPEAQMSIRTAFILQGSTPAEDVINTDTTWKCVRNKAYNPVPVYFFAASTGEMIDMSKSIKGDWHAPAYDDSAWPAAGKVADGKLKGVWDGSWWELVPSSIPQAEMTYQRIPSLRKTTGMDAPKGFPAQKGQVTIPANTTATFILDQTYLTNAYLTFKFSKGKGAGVSLRYAETMFETVQKDGSRKGNRNVIDGKVFWGRMDSLIVDGSADQSFTSLNYRTYRYIKLLIKTQNEPLVIDDIYGTFTGYPFKQTAVFNTDNTEIKNILDIGWRTARLNAVETYMDCPYYEQLQYIGDTRIQAMISYYYSGDDRLARNALNLMDHSRIAEGLTLSRYPSKGTQIISTFSLWYIGMLHDYWMYRDDPEFIKDKLTGERVVLDYFAKRQAADGSVKNVPYWTFVDWAGNLFMAPSSADGSSAMLDLQLLWAYQWAAEMEAQIGVKYYADLYHDKAEQLKKTIQIKYWDPAKGVYADVIEKNSYSQHVNALAILTGVVPEAEKAALAKRMLADKSLTQCTIYFKYYLHQALVKCGMGDDYIKWLDIWRENIKYGLTTWTEDSSVETTRSDCHAWGASPNIEFFRTVLGIDSDSPGFNSIKVEPHLGAITKVSGEIPHPQGKVAVAYALEKGKWKIKVNLPGKTSGVLLWKGNKYPLKAGENALVI